MNSYWISFVSNHINVGCCIVDADNPENAVKRAGELGINPGGQAMVVLLPPDAIDLEFWEKNKLISRDELRNSGYEKLGEEGKLNAAGRADVSIICEDCNQ